MTSGVNPRRRLILELEQGSTSTREVRRKRNEDRRLIPVHFRSLEAKFDFHEKYRLRRIVTGRCFVESFLVEVQFPYLDDLRNWGWLSFLTNQRQVYENLVKYFFYNGKLELLDDDYQAIPRTKELDGFHTFLDGKELHVRSRGVWEALGRPMNTPNGPTYSRKWFNHKKACRIIYGKPRLKEILQDINQLSFHNRILHFMVCQTLNPRQGSYTTITLEDIWLMARIIKRIPPNLHEYVMEKLQRTISLNKRTAKNKNKIVNRGLLHGKLVSEIISRKLGGRVDDTVLGRDTVGPFCFATVKQTGFKFDRNTGVWRKLDEVPLPDKNEENQEEGYDVEELLDHEEETSEVEGNLPLVESEGVEDEEDGEGEGPEGMEGAEDVDMGDSDGEAERNTDEAVRHAQAWADQDGGNAHETEAARVPQDIEAATAVKELKLEIDQLRAEACANNSCINAKLFGLEQAQNTILATLRAIQARVGVPIANESKL